MGVRISNEGEFDAIVYDGIKLFPNHFNIKINMNTTTEDSFLQNVAIRRIHFFFHELLHGAIFIQTNSPHLEDLATMMNENFLVTFPDEPYEHVVGMVLYDKISSILDGNFEIVNLMIGSSMNDDISFTITEKETFLREGDKHKPWWVRNDMATNDLFPIKDIPSWEEVDLGWEETYTFDGEKTPEVTIITGENVKN